MKWPLPERYSAGSSNSWMMPILIGEISVLPCLCHMPYLSLSILKILPFYYNILSIAGMYISMLSKRDLNSAAEVGGTGNQQLHLTPGGPQGTPQVQVS